MKESQILHIVMTVASILGGGAAMVGWAYGNFEQKDLARERLAAQEKRLERIEVKIDLIFDRLAGPKGKGY